MRLRDGAVIESGPVSTIPGHADTPLTPEQLWGKFRECTLDTHNEADARQLFDLLQDIDSLPSASALPTCTAIFND
jgi:hypothetical protein